MRAWQVFHICFSLPFLLLYFTFIFIEFGSKYVLVLYREKNMRISNIAETIKQATPARRVKFNLTR